MTEYEFADLLVSNSLAMVEVNVPESDAEELFAYVFDAAEINRAGGGIMWMGDQIMSTQYELGNDVPDESPRS